MEFAFWVERVTKLDNNKIIATGVNIFGDFEALFSSPYAGDVFLVNKKGATMENLIILGASSFNCAFSLYMECRNADISRSLITNISSIQKIKGEFIAIQMALFVKNEIPHIKSIPICSTSGWFGILETNKHLWKHQHSNIHAFSLNAEQNPGTEDVYIPGPHWGLKHRFTDITYLGVKKGSFCSKENTQKIHKEKLSITGYYPWRKRIKPIIARDREFTISQIPKIHTSNNLVSHCTIISHDVLEITNSRIRNTTISLSQIDYLHVSDCVLENINMSSNRAKTVIIENSKLTSVSICDHYDTLVLFNCSMNDVNLAKAHIKNGLLISCVFSDTFLPNTPTCFCFHRSTIVNHKELGATAKELKKPREIAFRHPKETIFISDLKNSELFGESESQILYNYLNEKKITTV